MVGECPLNAIIRWLGGTAFSHTLQETEWLVPAIQTVHILGVAAVFSSVLMVTLGIFGLYGAEQPLARRYSRFATVLKAGLPVLLVTGLLMIAAEPDRALPNPVFQLKMALLVVAAGATWLGGRRVRHASSGNGSSAGVALRALSVVTLLLWIGVLVSGRFIAYTLSR